MLSSCLKPTNQMIKSLIDIELGYINTNHPDFITDTQLLLEEDNSENKPKN